MKKYLLIPLLFFLLGFSQSSTASPAQPVVATLRGRYQTETTVRYIYNVNDQAVEFKIDGPCAPIRGGRVEINSSGQDVYLESGFSTSLEYGAKVAIERTRFGNPIVAVWFEFEYPGGLNANSRYTNFPAWVRLGENPNWYEVGLPQCDQSPIILPLVRG